MKPTISCLATLTLAMAACNSGDKNTDAKQNDLGTGINTINRMYVKSTTDTWNAMMSAVKSFELKIEGEHHDMMGGDLQAHRANGDKVIVRVLSMDEENTDVSVRVEPGNRNLADMIHDKIADKLGLKVAKPSLFGGNTCESTYPNSLDSCVRAAEGAARRLNFAVTNRDVMDALATIDAREANSNPVQFKMKKMGDGTKVMFIAGVEKTEANRDLAHRMRTEFESCCIANGN